MIDNVIKEQFVKNNILSNRSNIQHIITFRNFRGKYDLPIKVNHACYGYLYVDVKGIESEFKINYGDMEIFKTTLSSSYMIPIKYSEGQVCSIEGNCDSVSIHLYGCFCFKTHRDCLLPKVNMIGNGVGNFSLYSYNSVDDVIDNNLNENYTPGDKSFVQVCMKDGQVSIGLLKYVNDVYFYSNINNYTDGLLVNDSVEDVIFLQDASRNVYVFVYLKKGKVFYKIYNTQLSEEKEIYCTNGKNPIQLISSTIYGNSGLVFGIQFDDGTYEIYVIQSNNEISKIHEIKADFVRLLEFNNSIKVVVLKDYDLMVDEYNIVSPSDRVAYLSFVQEKMYTNALDYFEINNDKLVLTTGCQYCKVE